MLNAFDILGDFCLGITGANCTIKMPVDRDVDVLVYGGR